MYVLAKRALRNKDLPFVKIYFEELKRLDSSNKGDEYKVGDKDVGLRSRTKMTLLPSNFNPKVQS